VLTKTFNNNNNDNIDSVFVLNHPAPFRCFTWFCWQV